jgi:hypothetical protein
LVALSDTRKRKQNRSYWGRIAQGSQDNAAGVFTDHLAANLAKVNEVFTDLMVQDGDFEASVLKSRSVEVFVPTEQDVGQR